MPKAAAGGCDADSGAAVLRIPSPEEDRRRDHPAEAIGHAEEGCRKKIQPGVRRERENAKGRCRHKKGQDASLPDIQRAEVPVRLRHDDHGEDLPHGGEQEDLGVGKSLHLPDIRKIHGKGRAQYPHVHKEHEDAAEAVQHSVTAQFHGEISF